MLTITQPPPIHRLTLGILATLLLIEAAHPQTIVAPADPARPRIGLVLGGGGAKGAGHIGVLRVLEELRVPVDCVVGTSMGALVGATFAAGVAPTEIERAVLEIDWSETVGGQGQRDRTPIERKLSDLTYSNNLEFGVRDGALTPPTGLLATQSIENQIRTLVASAWFTERFDELPIPFRAIATDMVAGNMVVMGEGQLATAMRASMAIPGVFAPVVTEDGMVLSDGGMMRNLPVDIARELCADVVIAVWFSTTPPTDEDLASAFALLERSVGVMIGANQNAQIATLTDRDVGISVEMGDLRTDDFQRVPEAIELGRAAAQASREALLRYAVPESEYLAWAGSIVRRPARTHTLAEVRVEGLDRVTPDFVRSRVESAAPGRAVTAGEIAADAERIFSSGDFERVDYVVTGPESERVLELLPVEKSWGPDIMTFDIGLATSGGGDFRAILRADHNRTWVNPRGGRWHNAMQLGRQAQLQTDFYQPFDTEQRLFVHATAFAENDLQDLYNLGDHVAQYLVKEQYGQVDLGVNVGTRAQMRLGLHRGNVGADLDTGPSHLPDIEEQADSSVQGRLVYDTRDSVGLPTRGTLINGRWVKSSSALGGDLDYELIEAVYQQAFNFRGDSLSLVLGGAETIDGELPISQQFQIGGIRSFPGLKPGELRGDSYRFGAVRYAWLLRNIQPLLGQAVYAGLSLQAGRVGGRTDGGPEDTLYGIAGTLGGRTAIGAFLLSLGFVDNDSWELQFAVGRPLDEGSMLDELQ